GLMRWGFAALFVVALTVSGARLAPALTSAQIETAAGKATHGLREVTKRLAGHRIGGRDNGTPESNRAQRWLIQRMRRLGLGLMGDGRDEEAYRQPFVEAG